MSNVWFLKPRSFHACRDADNRDGNSEVLTQFMRQVDGGTAYGAGFRIYPPLHRIVPKERRAKRTCRCDGLESDGRANRIACRR